MITGFFKKRHELIFLSCVKSRKKGIWKERNLWAIYTRNPCLSDFCVQNSQKQVSPDPSRTRKRWWDDVGNKSWKKSWHSFDPGMEVQIPEARLKYMANLCARMCHTRPSFCQWTTMQLTWWRKCSQSTVLQIKIHKITVWFR